MIGISKIEAKFIQTCLEKERYFLTNEFISQYFFDQSKKALYQMLYRLRQKKLIFSIMNGHYLICPIKEWFTGKLSKKTFYRGILSYLSSINGIISGSSANYFYKNNALPKSAWEVSTKYPVTRTKSLKASKYKQKINFHVNKKIVENFKIFKIKDFIDNNIIKGEKPTSENIPEGYFGVETIDFY